VKIHGREIEAEFVGRESATTLVFLHEGLGSLGLWRDFPRQLSQATGLRAFVYSRAGYGKSEPAPMPRPVTYMHDEAKLLPDILEQAGIEDAILVGHSDGASIAILHAGEHRCRGLILEAPHVFTEPMGLKSIEEARDAYLNGDLKSRLARWHDNVDAAFWGWNGAWLHPDFVRWNIESSLPANEAPVLIIQGMNDQYGTQKQIDAIRRQSGGRVDALLLENCGHSPHRDQPEATLRAMTAFLQSLR
jgi:pimeloyl-ACP methyl ester carboxylesterase